MGYRVWAGWAKMSPKDVAWKSYTHLCIFRQRPMPTGDANLAMAGTPLASRRPSPKHIAIASKSFLLCLSGNGTGAILSFHRGCQHEGHIIQNIVDLLKEYGFDGTHWTGKSCREIMPEYVALHKELRAQLDKITPRPLLAAAVANWMFNRTTAEIHPYMDQMNNMSSGPGP